MNISEEILTLLECYMSDYSTNIWRAAVSDYAGSHTTTELDYLAEAIAVLANSPEQDIDISNALVAAGIPPLPEQCRTWLSQVSQGLRDKASEISTRGRKRPQKYTPHKPHSG